LEEYSRAVYKLPEDADVHAAIENALRSLEEAKYITANQADDDKFQGLVGFLNEKVDIYEDDKLLPRPRTIWS